MARQYYYLVAGFPELNLDVEQRTFDHVLLKSQIESSLHRDDLHLWHTMYLPYDNHNILNILAQKNDFDALGNFSKEEIQDAIDHNYSDNLPIYLQDFLQYVKDAKDTKNEQALSPLNLEMYLNSLFYEYVENLNDSFLQSWFKTDRNLRNLFTAITVRKLKKEASNYLVGNDDITHAMGKSLATDFGLKGNIDGLDILLQIAETKNIIRREQKFDAFKMDMLDDLTAFSYFSLQKILSFAIKMQLIERWTKLDNVLGEQKLKAILNGVMQSFDIQKLKN
ncbi:MAG: DUF2764 family protein [Bacteroidales bacterium]